MLAQYSDVTVPKPDPEFAPPQMPIKYEDPAPATQQSAGSGPSRTWPWPSSGIDALRAAVGRRRAFNRGVTSSQPGPPAPVALPQVGNQQPVTPPAPAGSTFTTAEPKQHHLPLGQPVPKDVIIKEDEGLISLMVRDAPLRQVVALVAETQNLNIVFASPADVPVTASFDRVPWQQVIEALLSISGHTWTMSDDIVFVTNIEAADFVSPEAGGRAVEVFELDFASAVDVDQTVQGLLSPAGNSWVLESSTEDNRRTREVVAVVDYPANIARISEYICQVDQPPRQVLIEANILQVELSDDCKNGINFDNLVSFSGNTIDFETGRIRQCSIHVGVLHGSRRRGARRLGRTPENHDRRQSPWRLPRSWPSADSNRTFKLVRSWVFASRRPRRPARSKAFSSWTLAWC